MVLFRLKTHQHGLPDTGFLGSSTVSLSPRHQPWPCLPFLVSSCHVSLLLQVRTCPSGGTLALGQHPVCSIHNRPISETLMQLSGFCGKLSSRSLGVDCH